VRLFGYGGLIEPEERLAEGVRGALLALSEGRMRVAIGAVVPLKEVNRALEALSGRGARGKLLLDVSGL